ncbi:MAG: hypothetical protein HY519_01030 [Candidatus Aenigmarchaeota archaeon]|nr:hypothetical protein [Candidatus Aenigmarchaeota archaeon]
MSRWTTKERMEHIREKYYERKRKWFIKVAFGIIALLLFYWLFTSLKAGEWLNAVVAFILFILVVILAIFVVDMHEDHLD